MKRPQGLAYVPAADTLFVANGGDGFLRMFEGVQYRALEPMHVGDDADNLRFDPESNLVYVAYGEGALGVVDVASRRKVRDFALTAHPESFQLEKQSNRIYVNVPKEQAIIVLDRASGHQLAKWQTGNKSNFPLALNPAARHVLVGFRNPASLVAFDASSGTPVAKVEACHRRHIRRCQAAEGLCQLRRRLPRRVRLRSIQARRTHSHLQRRENFSARIRDRSSFCSGTRDRGSSCHRLGVSARTMITLQRNILRDASERHPLKVPIRVIEIDEFLLQPYVLHR